MGVGFVRGSATPVAFWHPERDLLCIVHGDDFTFSGDEGDLRWIAEKMKQWFELKVRALLGGGVDDKEVVILGRLVKWHSWGISYEADPKHRGKVLECFNLLQESRSLSSTGARRDLNNYQADAVDLDREMATRLRGVAARMNYMAADMPNM